MVMLERKGADQKTDIASVEDSIKGENIFIYKAFVIKIV